jgi:peptide chain release factor subunit 1
MSALPAAATADPVRAAIERLVNIEPGPDVVSCYLKLEPRDRTRGKYVIKMKNRVQDAATALAKRPLEHAAREAVRADLDRVRGFFDDVANLPRTRGVALFACGARDLWEVVPLPHVHRARFAIAPTPLVLELVALEEEFGTIAVALCDRTSARFFIVTAYDVQELPDLIADATRAGRFHGERRVASGGVMAGGPGEYRYHQRIKTEKHRHYAGVADQLFRLNTQRPLTGIVLAGVGVDAAAVLPHLHSYLHDLILGVVRLNPKSATPAEVRDAALALREERERAWERAHATAAKEGYSTGWAVNGIDHTRRALQRGQVRTLLADGQSDDPRVDDAVEEAFRQRAQVDVLYDEKARRAVQGLAALLRFRR